MKRVSLLLTAVLFVFIGLASQANADLSGSSVTGVNPSSLPVGVPTDITFTFLNASEDWEYVDYFEVVLPPQWTINSVSYSPPTSDCENDSIEGINGQTVFWQTDAALPSFCGAWWEGTATFTANVTVNSCEGSPWSLAWFAEGDYYEESLEPHTVSGTVSVGCGAASTVPGCDFSTGRTETTTGGLFIKPAIVYSVPGQMAIPLMVIEPGKVFYVDKLDPTRTYRRALISCSWVWVEADAVVAPQDSPWNGAPLTNEILVPVVK